jgi:hypothetical protein
MDKLKKNAFAISISGIVLAALVLLYFLVIGKIQAELGADGVKGQLDKVQKDLNKLSKSAKVEYGENWFKTSQQAHQALKEAADAGKEFYEANREKFNEHHPEDMSPDDPSSFRAFYDSNVEKLQEDYRKLFLRPAVVAKEGEPAPAAAPGTEAPEPAAGDAQGQPAPAAAQPAAATPVPAVEPASKSGEEGATRYPEVQLYKNIGTVDDIQRARKEFWILSELFRVATEQKIGGLQQISFPERGVSTGSASSKAAAAAGAAEPREYRWIKSRIVLEMPLLKLDPFLTALFQSNRVSFRADSLTIDRPMNTMVVRSVDSKTYETKNEAEKDQPDSIQTEPPVRVTLDLAALDYLGPAAPAAASAPAPEGK